LIASSLIVVYLVSRSFLVGENRDRGDIRSMSAALPLRDPAYSSAGGGGVGDCGDCGFLSKFPSAESPKKGLSSRPRIHAVAERAVADLEG
jgi:hypothetical protein